MGVVGCSNNFVENLMWGEAYHYSQWFKDDSNFAEEFQFPVSDRQ